MVKSWYHNAQIYGQFMSNVYKIIRVSYLNAMVNAHITQYSPATVYIIEL